METAGRHFHVASRHLVDRPFGCECDWKDRLDVVVHLELGRLTLLHPALAVFEFRAVVARPTGVRIDFLAASLKLDGRGNVICYSELIAGRASTAEVRNDVNF